jgi:hypothetical protein
VVKGVSTEKLFSGDVSYLIKAPTLKARFTLYNTMINDQTLIRTYWHDSYNTTVNLIMKDVDQTYEGVEIGIEKVIKTSHLMQGALGYGQFIYSNRPMLEAWQDNNNAPIFQNRKTYLKGYYATGSPQLVAGMGYKYTSRRYWFAGVYANYLAERYVEPNPDRRTAEAVGKYQENETDLAEMITRQEKLPSFFLMNANAGRSWRIKRKYSLAAGLSVNNLLNNRSVLISGYESLRWDQMNINKFPNKYSYMPGISYMLNINCSF